MVIAEIVGAVQMVVSTAIGLISTTLNMATNSRESALVFGVMFMIGCVALVWFAYGQTNVERPSSISAALFGNITVDSSEINPVYNSSAIRAYVLASEMAYVGLPDGDSTLSRERQVMTRDQLLAWSPYDTDCQAKAAVAAGTDDYIWQGRLIGSSDFTDLLCQDCYMVECSWAPITSNATLAVAANLSALRDEIAATYNRTICSDQYPLSALRRYGIFPVASATDCWMIRNIATKERVYYTAPIPVPMFVTGGIFVSDVCYVDSHALTNVAMVTVGYSEDSSIGVRPGTHTPIVTENGTLSDVALLWTQAKYALVDATAGSAIDGLVKGGFSMAEGAIYALVMIVITMLGGIAIIAIAKVLL